MVDLRIRIFYLVQCSPPRDPRCWDIIISVQCPGSDPPRVSGHLTSAEYSATDQLVGGWHGGDTWVDTVETRVLFTVETRVLVTVETCDTCHVAA